VATLRLTETTTGSAVTVHAEGELVEGTASELASAVERAVADGAAEVTLDLRGAEHDPPTTVSVLIEALNTSQRTGASLGVLVDPGSLDELKSAATVAMFEVIDDLIGVKEEVTALLSASGNGDGAPIPAASPVTWVVSDP
jgi:anti-anti-sigma regulatory factor